MWYEICWKMDTPKNERSVGLDHEGPHAHWQSSGVQEPWVRDVFRQVSEGPWLSIQQKGWWNMMEHQCLDATILEQFWSAFPTCFCGITLGLLVYINVSNTCAQKQGRKPTDNLRQQHVKFVRVTGVAYCHAKGIMHKDRVHFFWAWECWIPSIIGPWIVAY